MFGKNVMCMGVLEVVLDQSKNVSIGASVCVVSDMSIICTRYFLIFKDAITAHAVCFNFYFLCYSLKVVHAFEIDCVRFDSFK